MYRLLILMAVLLIGHRTVAQQQANLLGTWSDLELFPSFVAENIYNEIWGYASDNKEYAIIGSTAGTHFIDVTNPSHPFEAHFVAGNDQGGEIIHRDYHDFNGFLYAVSDEGASSLQIMDLSNIDDTIVVMYDSDELIKTAHNIFIDEEQQILYAFATRNGAGSGYALRMFSIANEISPTFIAEHKFFAATSIGHVHDGFVKDNIAFLNCGWDGFYIVDFTNPQNPITKTKLTSYPQMGYNHSGWPSPNLDYYYMADETHGKDLKVLNICDLEAVSVMGTFNAGSSEANSMPHNQVVACNYLYVSYYYDGLQVYDISNPSQPVRVWKYDTYLSENDALYRGAWGVYPFLPSGNILVSDMQTGLYVFEAIDTSCTGWGITGEFEDDCEVDISSVIHEVSTSDNDWVNVYPTLLGIGATITLELKQVDNANVQLIDGTGKSIQNFSAIENDSNRLTLSNKLPNGMYFLKIISAIETAIKPIIVQ